MHPDSVSNLTTPQMYFLHLDLSSTKQSYAEVLASARKAKAANKPSDKHI